MDNAVSVMDPSENGADSNRFGMGLVTAVIWGERLSCRAKTAVSRAPEDFSKKLGKKAAKFLISRLFVVSLEGLKPLTSRMRSTRGTQMEQR